MKYHRKRTLTSLLNYDLVLSDKLMKGKYTYRMIFETHFPALVRIENDGFNDSEIGIPQQKVSVKDEALKMKDLLVTVDSETHSEDKVEQVTRPLSSTTTPFALCTWSRSALSDFKRCSLTCLQSSTSISQEMTL